ncbi:histidine--tRNA ligase [Chitinivorax sp. PXF-14]|uniref:histidine--tRNA ligase n=1 Tax=Chitinivorax sp. PXF-14 TaxID=3230488 RepID=UPI003467138E
MSVKIQAVKGMNDILPGDSDTWQFFEETIREWAASYGYRNIRTPIVEDTSLFVRSIGEVTDIVEKEMYSFEDALNGDKLTLRPEGTASCLRAVIQHNLLHAGPQRLWYMGQMYRHERPQKGRYRQFHQVGIEALGFAGPDIDAELLVMTASLWKRLGLRNIELQLNSLGTSEERARHRDALIRYLEQHQAALDEDGKRRLYTNPLRVLDTKNPALQDICNAAPKLADYLDDASRAHFEGVQALLSACDIEFSINPRLVRGLDYYNLTVFEWVTTELGSQGTVCGGGRYDPLIEQLGGKPTPACGFGMGIERLLLLIQEQGVATPDAAPDVYLVSQGQGIGGYVFQTAEALRASGLKVQQHCGEASFKSQMKKADASGARFAVLIGENEVGAGEVTVKPLLGQGEQQRVKIQQAAALILQ